MTRNKLFVASTGIAAAGLAILTGFYWHKDGESKYRPSLRTEIVSGEEENEAAGAAGAAEWWFNRMKNQVTGQLDYEEIVRVAELSNRTLASAGTQRNDHSSTASTVSWNELGPDNVGGRTRAILFDNQDPQHKHLFAGGVSGGLFESNDAGLNWHRCSGFFSVPGSTITVVTIAQAINGTLYVGTGEGNFYGLFGSGAGGFVGGGIYTSSDLGQSWSVLSSTQPSSQNSSSVAWLAVNKIACDPHNANHVYASTNKGFKVSNDGGATWTVPTGMSATAVSTDVQVNDDYVVAIVSGKPWTSHDGGATFTSTGTSAAGFTNSSLGRTTVAIAPSNKNYVYAFCAANAGSMYGVYVSTDGAMTWTQVCGAGNSQFDPFGGNNQGTYDNIVAVDPFDAGHAIFGGTALYEWNMVTSSPVAGQWNQIATEFPSSIYNPTYVHSDKHTIVFHPTQQGVFYIGCDGGIFRTINGGMTYAAMNSGYNVTQCYSVAFDHLSTLKNIAMAGCQDNGTQFVNGNGNTSMSADGINGGDGAWCEISWLNPSANFSTVYYGSLARSNNNGGSISSFYDSRITGLAGFENPGFASFVTPIRLWESSNDLLSGDSITIANTTTTQNKHVTDGTTATYSGTLSLAYPVANPAATIVLSSVIFAAGPDTIVSDMAGNLSGDGTGTVSTNGTYTLTFNSTPPANRVVKATFNVQYAAGTTFTVNSNVQGRTIPYTISTQMNPGDTVKVQDVIQSRLAVGFTGNNGIWITRRPIDFSTTPMWIKIGGSASTPNAYGGECSCLAWSADGNYLYAGTSSGNVYRFSNVGLVTDTVNGDVDAGNSMVNCTLIGTFAGRAVTAVDVNPNNMDEVVVSLGNYGNTAYVYYTNIATTATGPSGTFTNKTGNITTLGGVPAYSITFDKYQPNRVLVGTEHGVYETTNITAATPTYAAAMAGLDNVVVDMIRQQRHEPWQGVMNAGCFYIGTHGRGMWRDDSSWQMPTGISGPSQSNTSDNFVNNHDLRIFPNPVIDHSNVTFQVAKQGDVTLDIYDISGKHVYSKNYEANAGVNTIQFEAGEIVKGTYLVVVSQGAKRVGTGRFIKLD